MDIDREDNEGATGAEAGPAPDAGPANVNEDDDTDQGELNSEDSDEVLHFYNVDNMPFARYDEEQDSNDSLRSLIPLLGMRRPMRDDFADVGEEESLLDTNAAGNRLIETIFDMDLAAEHSYLGNNMDRVPGLEYLEAGGVYRLLLFLHRHIVYPGELLPFVIPGLIIDGDIDRNNGLLFGLTFAHVSCPRTHAMYGVTCQIYEKRSDGCGNTFIKSRALQRFVTTNDTSREHLEYISAGPQSKSFGHVKILPEIYLPELLSTINLGSMNRFRDLPGVQRYIRDFQASTTIWPKHVFKQYDINTLLEKITKSIEPHMIEAMPSDPVRLSFFLSRTSHFSEEQLQSIFITDSVHVRMKIIADSFSGDGGIFNCRFCRNQIAHTRDLFPMSKYGIQSQYCNSAGYIHEINTVFKVIESAVTLSGDPSTEFSWFPGYEWIIILCKTCNRHIGWRFRAVRNVTPAGFYGLTRVSVRIDKENKPPGTVPGVLNLNLIRFGPS